MGGDERLPEMSRERRVPDVGKKRWVGGEVVRPWVFQGRRELESEVQKR